MSTPQRPGRWTLAERSAAAGMGTIGAEARRTTTMAAGSAPAPEAAPAADPGPRHCYLIDPPGRPGKWPGVLIGWTRGLDGLWWGHVVYVVTDGGRESVVTEYVPAAHLRPATGR
jgi:hypothetical protein